MSTTQTLPIDDSTGDNMPAELLPKLDTEAYRRKLAGIADASVLAGSPSELAEIRESAVRLATILAQLFGDSLDRLTLWSRIDSAFGTADNLVTDGDLSRYASLCLDHVKADPARVAACEPLGQLLAVFASRPPGWGEALTKYIRLHRYPLLVFARDRWDQVKKGACDL